MRLLVRFEKLMFALCQKESAPPDPPSFVTSLTVGTPANDSGFSIVIELNASKTNVFDADDVIDVVTRIFDAWTPEPVVVTVALPEARRLSRSFTFSTALLAVGEQMPFEQLMFWVTSAEITTSAHAGGEARKIAAILAKRALQRSLDKVIAESISSPRETSCQD